MAALAPAQRGRLERPWLRYTAMGLKDCELQPKYISRRLTTALDAQVKVFQQWHHMSRSQCLELILYPVKT